MYFTFQVKETKLLKTYITEHTCCYVLTADICGYDWFSFGACSVSIVIAA